ncbi:mycofactocin biosynthesis glycosyltransferase MftF [Thermomonospora cellulosilytica]|uniref:Mycofactocin system glycosyltransferase n=1 Tax=Thermomonospora cellulosilytica TaxID=1411118 RepID=A0A7W3N0S7_9ACTN|nr:mycofactocin biosynthesis glycosyltransferase MftF [Thermomonospora cellulosilytica]MBA9005362.1 mycofactocin system glycosyltransferase [Thermomonospora cellulosilytica]
MIPPLPNGFRITLDAATRRLAEGLWFGGSPARVMRLSDAGLAAWRELADGPVSSPVTGALARRLTDAGLAHPCPPGIDAADVTVVIPVLDRPALLDRCLSALGDRHPVLVVDDGSADGAAIAEVARRHGAKLVRRPVNGGPAAARNTGLEHTAGELVAFIDSDCLPEPGWVDRLAGHFADPLVAAVAPRIVALAPDTGPGRYARANGGLDLGDRPARVAPGARVSYVPTAALMARRSALLDVARGGEAFDPAMPVGEDVDLVWRLHENGWRIRYDPAVRIGHHEPPTWGGLLSRRFRYGTSAAPLAVRHPTSVSPLALHPWPALTVAALLARRPLAAAAAFGMANLTMYRRLRKAGIPTRGVPRAMAEATYRTWLGTGRYATQFAGPALLALLAAGGRNRWPRRVATASLLLGPPLATWSERRPALDPVRFTLGVLADDMAYGAGVWAGCLRHRTAVPVRPMIVRRTV